MPPHLAELGAVYAFQLPRGRWGACQVIADRRRSAEPHVELITLDYFGKQRPTPDDVRELGVLLQDWAYLEGTPARVHVPVRVPWWALKVTVVPPLATFEDACFSSGNWQTIFGAWHRYRWYARENARPRWGDMGEVAIDDIDASDTAVSYAGDDPLFPFFVAQRRFERLQWNVGAARFVDLSVSSLLHAEIQATGSLELRLPSTLQRLTLIGPADRFTVTGVDPDFPFELVICSPHIVAPPKGLERVQIVTYRDLVETDSDALAPYTRLAELTLRGAPGALRDGRGLARLTTLRELSLEELYELHDSGWPRWLPAVDVLRLRGVSAADAMVLSRGELRAGTLEMSDLRDEAWIARHVPARDSGGARGPRAAR